MVVNIKLWMHNLVDLSPQVPDEKQMRWVHSFATLASCVMSESEELAQNKVQDPDAILKAFGKALDEDPYGRAMKHFLVTSEWLNGPKIRAWASTIGEDCIITENGLLYCLVQLKGDENYLQQLYVPAVSRDDLLDEAHSGPLLAHTGIAKMLIKLQHFYYWPRMKCDIMQ